MKKTQLIEWGIITVGIIFGYKFLESVFSALVFLTYEFRGGYSEVNSTLITTIILTLIYAAGFFVLIRQSRPI